MIANINFLTNEANRTRKAGQFNPAGQRGIWVIAYLHRALVLRTITRVTSLRFLICTKLYRLTGVYISESTGVTA